MVSVGLSPDSTVNKKLLPWDPDVVSSSFFEKYFYPNYKTTSFHLLIGIVWDDKYIKKDGTCIDITTTKLKTR